MTSGGPGSATSLIAYKLMLESIKSLNYGYASTIAVMLFMAMVIITIVGKGLTKKLMKQFNNPNFMKKSRFRGLF
jgi:multiple sugar transport system permease protein